MAGRREGRHTYSRLVFFPFLSFFSFFSSFSRFFLSFVLLFFFFSLLFPVFSLLFSFFFFGQHYVFVCRPFSASSLS